LVRAARNYGIGYQERKDVKKLEASLETGIDRKKQSELAGFV
jgi:hypothetical protein